MTPRRRSTDAPAVRRRRALSIVAGLVTGLSVAVIVGVATYGIAANQQSTEAARAAALVIQVERRANTQRTCLTTNAANRRTKRIIRRAFPPGPSRVVTLKLVDALAPYHEDCAARARALVATVKDP